MNTQKLTDLNALPTIAEAVGFVLSELKGPMDLDSFAEKVLEIRPSSAKKPTASIRDHLKTYHEGKSIVYLNSKTIMPLSMAMSGIRFRIRLSQHELNQGILMILPYFYIFISSIDDAQKCKLVDSQCQILPTHLVKVKRNVTKSYGFSDVSGYAFDLSDWQDIYDAQIDDSILVTIESWEPKTFKLELEPHEQYLRHLDEIKSKNQELADILFDMLEASYDECIYPYTAIPTAYVRMSDPQGYPGDHWLDVVSNDSRMKLSDIGITYPERRNFFDLTDKELPVTKQKLTTQQKEQVYLFKAASKYRPSLWRRIEIQGKHTLADFHKILRNAFSHDMDHMGGFWRLIPRGHGHRFREIRLGDVDPFGDGTGADIRIAELGLAEGDKLKYVYDFGDYIEHEITLEAINVPLNDVRYPRILEQNKPRYRYCERCKSEGRKTIATYICVDCSNDQQQEVRVCEFCLELAHEDHFAVEILY